MSLDGFVAGPDGELDWMWWAFGEDLKKSIMKTLAEVDTHLMGRFNYQQQAGHWPTSTDEIAPLVNNAAKVVFSSSLTEVEWANSRLATSDAATEIASLMQQPGKDIAVTGGARFAQSLIRLGLIDEYNLIVHPVVLGAGLALFADLAEPLRLQLIGQEGFDSGVVRLRYRPGGAA